MSRRIVIVSTFLVVFSILAIWLAGCSTKTTIDEEIVIPSDYLLQET